MTCEEALLLISGRLDRENSEEEEAQLQAHLTQCSSCRELLQVLQENDETVLHLTREAPTDLCANVMQSVRQEVTGHKRQSRAWISVGIAAALAVVLGVSALSMLGAEKPGGEPMATAYTSQETGEEPQPALYYVEMARMADQPAEACYSLAIQIAEERCADVVWLEELPQELADAEYETVEEGWRLYLLPTAETAAQLSVQYQAELTQPTKSDPACTVSYALIKE